LRVDDDGTLVIAAAFHYNRHDPVAATNSRTWAKLLRKAKCTEYCRTDSYREW
jgi:hypothetical protein